MTNLIDPIDRLRAERPEITAPDVVVPDMVVAPPRVVRRSPRRRRLQLGIAAAVAVAIVLTGAITLRPNEQGSARLARGISQAEARELAATALTDIAKLDEWTTTSRWTTTEAGGTKRSETSYRVTRTDTGRSLQMTTRNDFLDQPERKSVETRVVDGRTYRETRSTFFGTRWLLQVRDLPRLGGTSGSGSGFAFDSFTPPDFSQFVEQLEREGLIGARRESDGTVVIQIDRTAKELAPVDGASIISDGRFGGLGLDPISSFAMGIAFRQPDRPVRVELRIDADGALSRIRMTTTNVESHVGNRADQEMVATDLETELSWRRPDHDVVAPDPTDVTVVGDALRARRGATGTFGVHGTLDTFTPEELESLRVQAVREQARLQRTKIARQPARHYPKLFARKKAEMRERRRAIHAFAPFDRAELARNEACTPYWPDTGRAMDRDEAERDPSAAGWKCMLPGKLCGFSIAPGSDSPSPFQGGGMTIMSSSAAE